MFRGTPYPGGILCICKGKIVGTQDFSRLERFFREGETQDATPRQKKAITRLYIALGIRQPFEDRQMSKGEAGRLVRTLSQDLQIRRQLKQ